MARYSDNMAKCIDDIFGSDDEDENDTEGSLVDFIVSDESASLVFDSDDEILREPVKAQRKRGRPKKSATGGVAVVTPSPKKRNRRIVAAASDSDNDNKEPASPVANKPAK